VLNLTPWNPVFGIVGVGLSFSVAPAIWSTMPLMSRQESIAYAMCWVQTVENLGLIISNAVVRAPLESIVSWSCDVTEIVRAQGGWLSDQAGHTYTNAVYYFALNAAMCCGVSLATYVVDLGTGGLLTSRTKASALRTATVVVASHDDHDEHDNATHSRQVQPPPPRLSPS